jgi:hypothetical protein
MKTLGALAFFCGLRLRAEKCATESLSASTVRTIRMVSPNSPRADYAVSETAVGTPSAHFGFMVARSAMTEVHP